MNYIILICAVLLFSCKTETHQTPMIEQTAVDTLPEQIQDSIPTNDSFQPVVLKKYVSESSSPVPFITYYEETMKVVEGSSQEGSSTLFRLNDAVVSFTVLPTSFQSKQQGIKYLKELLEMSAENIKIDEEGFYTGTSLVKIQKGFVGQQNGRIFYWLADYPFSDKEQFEPLYLSIISHQQFIEL